MSSTVHDAPGRLAGRVAIVTGASRGIGQAIAAALAAEGAAVAVGARTEQVWSERLPGTVHETAERIRASGGRAIGVRCDVAKEDDLVALVEAARREFGPVDLLVNNAAVTVSGRPPEPGSSAAAPVIKMPSFWEMPIKAYRIQFEVNLFAAYRLMQLVLPDMVAAGRGSIINISTDAAHRPGEGPYPPTRAPMSIGYGGSKAALEHLTQCVAYEVDQRGVAVNCLLPSLAVPTPAMRIMGEQFLRETVSAESFAEAAVRVAAMTPAEASGQILYSEDVLHPELGRRGWLGARDW